MILPDLGAGCSLADMANIEQVENCWRQLGEVIDTGDLMPITYVNSAASLKAFCGRHGGIVCTSANARAALQWAFARRGRVLFFPDQHLGRNTAKAMGIPLEAMPLWDPRKDEFGGNTPEIIWQSRVILWQGDCSVHQRFLPRHVQEFRQKYPGIKILVHPECSMEVVDAADVVGSTGASSARWKRPRRARNGPSARNYILLIDSNNNIPNKKSTFFRPCRVSARPCL